MCKSMTVRIYFLRFSWATEITDHVERALTVFSDTNADRKDRENHINANLMSEENRVELPEFECVTVSDLTHILHTVQHESGIFIFPFQYPIDAWAISGQDYSMEYDRVLDIVRDQNFRTRSRAICICGSPIDRLMNNRIDEPYLVRDWSEKSFSLWIQKPQNEWDVVLAIEYILARDMYP